MTSIEGRVVVITGASRGIGAAMAQRFAMDGDRVALVARTLEPDPRYPGTLQETLETVLEVGGSGIAVQADLSKQDERQRLVCEVEDQLGPVDVLVNNAAVSWMLPVAEFPRKRFDLMMELQVWAPLALAQLVLPTMRARGAGRILNITSRSAMHPQGPPFEAVHATGNVAVYGMCKAALDRLTTGMAAELFSSGILVNALAPWQVVSTHGAAAHNLVKDDLEPPDVIAEAAVALCAPESLLTGTICYSSKLLGGLGRTVTPLPLPVR